MLNFEDFEKTYNIYNIRHKLAKWLCVYNNNYDIAMWIVKERKHNNNKKNTERNKKMNEQRKK